MVNHDDIAVFKYDFTMFMTPEEIQKLPKEQQLEPLVPAKSLDFSKAERVYITREEIIRREQEAAEQMRRVE